MKQKQHRGILIKDYHCWICSKLIAYGPPVFQREKAYTLCGSCLLKLTKPDQAQKRKDATA